MRHQKLLLIIVLLMCLGLVYERRAQVLTAEASPASPVLMPAPAEMHLHPGRLRIRRSFSVAVRGPSDDRLRRGIERAVERLSQRTGMRLASRLAREARTTTLVVACEGPGPETPSPEEDESYRLEVSTRQAVLRAATVVGALRGLETLQQLVEGERGSYYLPEVEIQDRPRFRWRGLMIDVSRHWQPVEVIERNLDGMAAVKLNVLHWHLTDDQGFRIESRRYPKLHEMGSDGVEHPTRRKDDVARGPLSEQHYYTQEQVRALVAYARDRGIRVVPEFDVPSHTMGWVVGYPEYAGGPGPYQIERRFGIKDATLDPTREEVYQFLDGFVEEMAGLFPDACMHMGGDENNGREWRSNPRIQAFMKAQQIPDTRALQAYFSRRVAEILQKHGKRMVGWEEVLQADLPKGVVVHSWRGPASLRTSAERGYDAILSSGYYLDAIRPAARHYVVDPLPAESGLSPEQAAHILGGEACMWGEYVNPVNIDSRIWPRTAAIAERLWSPREVTDVEDMYRRLEVVSQELGALGLTHESYLDPMLRRMAGSDAIGPLRTLCDVVEPLPLGQRGRAVPVTTETPLTRLVDAARPDSATARHFAAAVESCLADAPHFKAHQEEIRSTLLAWRNVRPAIDRMTEHSPSLGELQPVAVDLSAIGTLGIEALDALTSRLPPTDRWGVASLLALDQARRPKAEVTLAVLPAMKELVMAAVEVDGLKRMPPAEWTAHVKDLAGARR